MRSSLSAARRRIRQERIWVVNHPSVRAESLEGLASGGVTCRIVRCWFCSSPPSPRSTSSPGPPRARRRRRRRSLMSGSSPMTWKDLHDKILEMAKDTVFPDDKLGWKPHPDSRSVLDEFRQVTIGLEFSLGTAARREARRRRGPPRAGRPTTASRRRAPRWSARWKPRSRSRIRSWKSLPRRCSSAGSVTRPSITASSSPTTAPSASSRRSSRKPASQ